MFTPEESTWSVGARSETGYVRDENQDRMSWIRAPFGDVYIVSDGMGGPGDGALAAELTVQALQRHLGQVRTGYLLRGAVRRAFEGANAAVYARAYREGGTPGMGATAVLAVLRAPGIMVAHVGDSRAYLCNGAGCHRLTRDHSPVQHMVDSGQLTEAQALAHPDANLIERAVGLAQHIEVEIGAWLPLRDGDRVLLCTDGLCGYASDAEIARVLRDCPDPQEATDGLVDLALARGGEDNVTVQVIRYRDGAAPARGMRPRDYLAVVLTTAVASAATTVASQRYLAPPPQPQNALVERQVAQLRERVHVHETASNHLLQRAGAHIDTLDARLTELEQKLARPPPQQRPQAPPGGAGAQPGNSMPADFHTKATIP